MLDRDGYFAAYAETHGGYRPQSSRWAAGYLGGVYRLARPLAARGTDPAGLTAAAALTALAAAALAAPGRARPLLAGAAIGASGVLDSVDGAVALLSDRASPRGMLADSLADRLADAAHLLALRRLGAPPAACVAAGAAGFALEYARARAAVAGLPGIGVVTVGERPSRVALASVATTVASPLGSRAAVAGSAALTAVALAGLGQFLRVCARQLPR